MEGAFLRPSYSTSAIVFRGDPRSQLRPAFGLAVAEMELGLALGAIRRIVWNDVDFRNGKGHWSHRETRGEFSIYGEPAGFIGFGSLGRCLKPLLEPFGFPIQVYDPWMTDPYLESQGVTPVNLETLLSTSRLIFVLATPTESNRAFLDRSQLELIRPDGILSSSAAPTWSILVPSRISCSRGVSRPPSMSFPRNRYRWTTPFFRRRTSSYQATAPVPQIRPSRA